MAEPASAAPPPDDLPPLPTIPTGRYRHYKGGEYAVLGVVRHSESLEPMVLYRPLGADRGDWTRPYAMFVETAHFDGRLQPRFQRIDGPPAAGLRWRSARLRVRSWHPDDLPALQAVYGDAQAMRWVGDGQPLSAADCERWLAVTQENYRRRGYGMFAIELAEASGTDPAGHAGEAIGFIGLVHPGGQADAELKYALHRSHWGQGYATEAVRGLLSHALQAHGIARVIATAAPDNVASHRVLLKAGLQRSALRRNEGARADDRQADGPRTQRFEWTAAAPTPDAVARFLHHFEALAMQEDFALLREQIAPDAVFRYNDGDHVGLAAIEAAFERSWRGDPTVRKASFTLSDIVVLHTDIASASATYDWHWTGAQGDRRFAIQGRGTRVLRWDGVQFRIAHEHLSRCPPAR